MSTYVFSPPRSEFSALDLAIFFSSCYFDLQHLKATGGRVGYRGAFGRVFPLDFQLLIGSHLCPYLRIKRVASDLGRIFEGESGTYSSFGVRLRLNLEEVPDRMPER